MEDEIAKWSGVTETHGFYVAVFRKPTTELAARIYAYTPITSDSNGLSTTTKFFGPSEVTAPVLSDLEQRVRERIARQFGQIARFES